MLDHLEMLLCLCKFENILKTPKFGKLCNDSRIVENVYKVLVLKIFVENERLKICFEDANVRPFCNDSRIIENVCKVLVLKIFVERECLERCLKIPM